VTKELGKSSYYQLQVKAGCTFPTSAGADATISGSVPLAKANDNNLLVCPAAGQASSAFDTVNSDGTFEMWGSAPGSEPQYVPGYNPIGIQNTCAHVYWCYVINSKIDNSLQNIPGSLRDTRAGGSGFLRISQIHQSALTALLVEKMMSTTEGNVTVQENIAVGKTSYTVFTARHNNGGHLLFADGHVAWFSNKELDPLTAGFTLSATNYAANLPNKVIWDPLQQPLY